MPLRPLSPSEIEEVQNMIAECDLKPDRRQHYFAELIRLREFAAFANRYRSLPLKVRQAFEQSVPPKQSIRDWVEIGAEDATEQALHMPDPVKPHRSF